MNIAIIGKFYTEGSGLHIEETLIEMGHKPIRIDPEAKFLQYKFMGFRGRNMAKTFYTQFLGKIPAIRRIKANKIYKVFKSEKIELSIVLHDYFSTEEITEIKKINSSPIVIWFPDAISNFQKSMFFVAGYDHLFFVDKYIVEKLKEEFLLNIHYLPQCSNPNHHKRVNVNEKEKEFYQCEITNAGNLYPSRIALYKHLTNYNFKMWGSKPSYWLNIHEINKIITGHVVFNQEKAKAFSSAKIVLNNLHPAVINGVNKRMFEIPACGGFQITSHRDAINELFEVGKEIITYKNFKDLKMKIDYYLDPKNDEERKKIMEAGYNKVMKEHTYENRLTQLINTVEVN
ncbi:MAG: glycosyltransferase [Vicingaceae bacterium]|nr:glycosyltransferase [Vicingaceae bacterium]